MSSEMVTLHCALVGVKGNTFLVDISTNKYVGHLKETIKKQNKRRIQCDAGELALYLAKKSDGTWLNKESAAGVTLDDEGHAVLKDENERPQRLEQMDPVLWIKNPKYFGDHFEPNEGEIHVLVVVKEVVSPMAAPALSNSPLTFEMLSWDDIDPRTNTPYRVDRNEFTLSDYKVHSLIPTTKLNHFFHSIYGSFPATYFVREEEKKLWDIMLARLDDSETGQTQQVSYFTNTSRPRMKPTVIVGSPGVGKSVFLMMLSFYVSLVRNHPVLILRKLEDERYDYVFMNASGFNRGPTELTQFEYIRHFCDGALVFLDGFNDSEVNTCPTFSYLRPFRVLATSFQYDLKSDDPAGLVVLPAWRVNDLQVYAEKTQWVKDVQLRQRQDDKVIPMLVKLQYFYSGGSMREFCRNHEDCVARCWKVARSVSTLHQYQLISNFGQESKGEVDQIRRHYIEDISNVEHYHNSLYWQLSVDSGWTMRWLQSNREVGNGYDFYQHAKAIGGGFYDTAFEVLFHYTAQQFHQTHKIVLKTSDTSEYTQVELEMDHVSCSGNGLEACHNLLKSLPDGTYWYPDYGYFPFIDGVCPCWLVERSGRKVETLAFIQVTVAKAKVFRLHRMAELEKLQRNNPHLRGYEPIYLVVTPSRTSCDAFELVQQDDRNPTDVIDYDLSDFEDECPEEAVDARDEQKHSVQGHDDASLGDNAMKIDPSERQSSKVSTSWKQIITYLDPESIYYYGTKAHLVAKDTGRNKSISSERSGWLSPYGR